MDLPLADVTVACADFVSRLTGVLTEAKPVDCKPACLATRRSSRLLSVAPPSSASSSSTDSGLGCSESPPTIHSGSTTPLPLLVGQDSLRVENKLNTSHLGVQRRSVDNDYHSALDQFFSPIDSANESCIRPVEVKVSSQKPLCAKSNVYEVETLILQNKYNKRFLVKWRHYCVTESTWQSRHDLGNAMELVRAFRHRVNLFDRIYNNLVNKEAYSLFHDFRKGIVSAEFLKTTEIELQINEYNRSAALPEVFVVNWTGQPCSTTININFIKGMLFDNRLLRKLQSRKTRCCRCSAGVCVQGKCPCGPQTTGCNNFTECLYNCACRKNTKKVPWFDRFKKILTVPLVVFMTPNRGWSIFAASQITKGTYVMEYVGVLRLENDVKGMKDETYLFALDGYDDCKYVIDASEYGHLSRLLNHSCLPNLEQKIITGQFADGDYYQRIVFVAACRIEIGEELTFDYFQRDVDVSKVTPETVKCLCGAQGCRGYMI